MILSFIQESPPHRDLHSFPTRRSSDLRDAAFTVDGPRGPRYEAQQGPIILARKTGAAILDRKSTRLNSSHEWISYAVFCLKKKNISEGEKITKQLMPISPEATLRSRRQ